MKISIIIPTYEMMDLGWLYLKEGLKSISIQDYKNIEVIISDHSVDDKIEKVCSDFKNLLDIKYVKNNRNRGSSSANLNNAILHAKGDVVKILMQDDFLHDEKSISIIADKFSNTDITWLATSYIHIYENRFFSNIIKPYWTHDILLGNNKIGPPSIISCRLDKILPFNVGLIWMMDCDFYKRMYDLYGEPYILESCGIRVNIHQNQLTNLITRERKDYEEKYTRSLLD